MDEPILPEIPKFIKRSELARRMYPESKEARIKLTQKMNKLGTTRMLPADIALMRAELKKMIIELEKIVNNEK